MIVFLPGSGTRCLRHNMTCRGWSYSFEAFPVCDPPKVFAVCVPAPLSEVEILALMPGLAENVDKLASED